MPSTILVAEADAATATFLTDQLAADGHHAPSASSARAAAMAAGGLAPALLLLGDLPERREALELLGDVRAGRPPWDPALVVLVVSHQHGELDVLRAYQHGADDVVAKPFSYPLLRARLGALLRRAGGGFERRVTRVRGLEIDTRSRQVHLDGEKIELTQLEYALLCQLASDPERVFSKGELLRAVWGLRSSSRTRTLDSHACRLRRKLRRTGDERWLISAWGVGYALRPDEAA